MFSLVKGLMIDSKEVEGGRCMRVSDENNESGGKGVGRKAS